MPKTERESLLKGPFTHRRTESDYMAALLEAVTLEDWRGIVAATVAAAKDGDTSARTFLAQYLIGRPELKAPAPVTVVVQQLSGRDPLVDRLASPHIDRLRYPNDNDEDAEDMVKALVADELRALESDAARPTDSAVSIGVNECLSAKLAK